MPCKSRADQAAPPTVSPAPYSAPSASSAIPQPAPSLPASSQLFSPPPRPHPPPAAPAPAAPEPPPPPPPASPRHRAPNAAPVISPHVSSDCLPSRPLALSTTRPPLSFPQSPS